MHVLSWSTFHLNQEIKCGLLRNCKKEGCNSCLEIIKWIQCMIVFQLFLSYKSRHKIVNLRTGLRTESRNMTFKPNCNWTTLVTHQPELSFSVINWYSLVTETAINFVNVTLKSSSYWNLIVVVLVFAICWYWCYEAVTLVEICRKPLFNSNNLWCAHIL